MNQEPFYSMKQNHCSGLRAKSYNFTVNFLTNFYSLCFSIADSRTKNITVIECQSVYRKTGLKARAYFLFVCII